jgi:hypothetical protein
MLLSDLKPLDYILDALRRDDCDGKLGEMLAVHLCLMIGLRVVAWRKCLPAEIDLTADRVTALSYQRFHIQVKNTSGDLEIDRVDREVGAAAGTGATHILFVVPRAGLTRAARAEILAKSRNTSLHIYALTKESLKPPVRAASLLEALRFQGLSLATAKQNQAERREKSE